MSSKKKARKTTKNRWPLFLVIGGIIVLGIVLIVAFQKKAVPYTPETTGSPSLQPDQQTVDLGNEKLGSTVQVSFTLKNVGDQSLVFTKVPYIEVVEGCCPPTPTIGSMTLQPGETTTVSFPLMMHASMGGKHDLRVHIPNNDPKNKDFEFKLLSNWIE